MANLDKSACLQGRQHALRPHFCFHPAPFLALGFSALFRSFLHYRQFRLLHHRLNTSTFLAGLRSTGITRLLHYYTASDFCGSLTRPTFRRSPRLTSLELPTIPSPTTPRVHKMPLSRYPSGSCPCQVSLTFELHHFPAGSLFPLSRIEFVSYRLVVLLRLLPTPPHDDAVAVEYGPENVCPIRDFHPTVQVRLRAHWERPPRREPVRTTEGPPTVSSVAQRSTVNGQRSECSRS